ncbi:topoisomerase DNA-binding C4 zinc finger domain-containing protein [Desulfosporosinus shakirovi]|uniref:topoisomerase DNA-binding C4 zinc finger domain-containing protein n=1 Tax=Desulfosporosinus shakirovi TaxID=2885154 RepID=UPI00289B1894|nr:topoisomerase DNA-binding C4 zinc finger domain-containing protein [Desulfosporosinus sp. SRJS8]
MKNLGYRKCLQLYELLEIGCQIFRSQVTHVIKKSELSMSKVYIIKKAEVANQIGANSCPKCGGELIARMGEFGDFKGCNNYPKCRFTIIN